MSNYPPGVTGNEWQIAGCDEYAGHRLCAECDEWSDVDIQCGGGIESWNCQECGEDNEHESPDW